MQEGESQVLRVGQNEISSKESFKNHTTLTLNKGCNVKCQEMALLIGNSKHKHEEMEAEEPSRELRSQRPSRKKTGADAEVSECLMKGTIIIILWTLGNSYKCSN